MELNGNKRASRQRIVGAMVLGVGLLFVFRLFQMQVTTDDWKNRAERLTEEQEVLQPARGLCLDRHGELLVNNVPSYDLMVVPARCPTWTLLPSLNWWDWIGKSWTNDSPRPAGIRATKRPLCCASSTPRNTPPCRLSCGDTLGCPSAPNPFVKTCLASQARLWASTGKWTGKT